MVYLELGLHEPLNVITKLHFFSAYAVTLLISRTRTLVEFYFLEFPSRIKLYLAAHHGFGEDAIDTPISLSYR